ncbi:MAG: sigma-70 family RNA polymerase sigma factor [Candidatus Aminicenantes bacterium]|nr:sigma-70 family RNA polymerase sigma factor [Candidatus Aminicenantes bacterium]
MDERPEDDLVEDARRGSREAFAGLVRLHERRVYGLVYRLAGNHADAADLAQEVFLTAWRSIASFRRGSSFYTWLYRIAVNTSLTFLRKRRREKDRAEFDENMPGVHTGGDASFSAEASCSRSELRARLDEAIDSLPGRFRASFALVVSQGLSHADAAAILGCSENTVSWRMHKVRKILRARLKPYLGEVRS